MLTICLTYALHMLSICTILEIEIELELEIKIEIQIKNIFAKFEKSNGH